MPYLNVTAKWEGAPDQGLLQKKGGRGFPFVTIMNASGEVVWEVRPTSKEVVETALGDAGHLVKLRKKSKANADNQALAANVALLDALGRSQRKAPSVDELDKAAAVAGVDAKILERYNKWRKGQALQQAMQKFREDGGIAVYDIFKKGEAPEDGDPSAIGFYYYATKGAIKAGDAEAAMKTVDKFVAEASKNPRFAERAKKDADGMREEIKAIEKK